MVIFQGVSRQVAARPLSRIVEPTTWTWPDLPDHRPAAGRGDDRRRRPADARRIVTRLRAQATSCDVDEPLPSGCPPRPSPSSSATPGRTVSGTAVATPRSRPPGRAASPRRSSSSPALAIGVGASPRWGGHRRPAAPGVLDLVGRRRRPGGGRARGRPGPGALAGPGDAPGRVAINVLGLALIARLDVAEAVKASHPGPPTAAGHRTQQLTVDRARSRAVRAGAGRGSGPAPAAALHLHGHGGRPRPAPAPAGPCPRRDAQRGKHLDPRRRLSVPAGRGGEARPHRLLRGIPRRHARRARRGPQPRDGDRPAPRTGPRTDPRRLAGEPWACSSSRGPRHLPAVLRPVRGDAVRRHRVDAAGSSSGPCCSCSARQPPTCSSATWPSASTPGWTPSPTPPGAASRTPRPCTGWLTGASSAPGSGRAAPTSCPTPTRTSSSRRWARSWA